MKSRERESRALRLAFTLAEVLIVLTILGIIAAVSMVTLKPAEFKAKGMKVAAKKAMYDIDTATTEILLNDSTMEGDVVKIPAAQCTGPNLKALYSKYLTKLNKTSQSSYYASYDHMVLKSGTTVFFGSTSGVSVTYDFLRFPGDTSARTVTIDCGIIYFDINDADEPNTFGSDVFAIPINRTGIVY